MNAVWAAALLRPLALKMETLQQPLCRELRNLGNGLSDVNEGQGAESLKVHFITL